ncbi:MAG: protein kinase domain-containing protein [Acidimicrobiales bacterium]
MSDPTFFGAYQVDRLLGSGGFADVFLCYHPGLETRVAVKVLHPHLARMPDICERFLHEAQVLWRADSDRVIQVTHVDQLPDARPYFVMRHADRGPLDAVLAERRERTGAPPSLRETVGLVADLIDCLAVLRDRNLVHRDLKPSNVLVKSISTPDHVRTEKYGLPADERLVLADFGLAKRLSDGTNLISHLGGTPAYMAPELADINADVTWRVDLFAVGVIAFEIAAGSIPWPERRFEHVRDVDLSAVSIQRWRDDFPPQFDDVVLRALAPDPMDRYDSPASFAEAIEGLLGAEAPPPPGGRSVDRVRQVVEDLEPHIVAPELQTVLASAREALDAPVRIGVIGGNRLSPSPLGLKLMGQRPAPGEASLLGSVVVRMRHGKPSLSATLRSGEQVGGEWHTDDSGAIALRFGVSPWTIESVELTLDQPDFDGLEVIEIPHAVLRRSRALVAALYETFDIAVIGVPADPTVEVFTVEEVLALGRQAGPVAMVGVRQVGAAADPNHPVLAATVPGDDTIELKVLLGELLGGTRIDDCRASRALTMIRQIVYHGHIHGDWEQRVAAIHRELPAVEELTVTRLDLLQSPWDDDARRQLHRALGRRVAAARLHAGADTPVEQLLDRVRALGAAWERRSGVEPYSAQVVQASLRRLATDLGDRLERQAQ